MMCLGVEMDRGWISIYRKIQDSEIWSGEKFTKGQAWVDMILMANHKDKTFFIRGNEVKVKRGQIARAERTFCEKWGWSRGKVRRYFEWLETRHQIVQQKSKLISILTLVNYNKFQQNGTSDSTTDGPQTVQQTDQNNNVNKDKNDKKDTITKDKKTIDHFELFWKAYPKKVAKKVAYQSYSKISQSKEQLQIILKAIEEQKQSIDWTKDDGQFIPHPATWLNQGRWTDELQKPPKPKPNRFLDLPEDFDEYHDYAE